jgi:hypothetical protein
LNERRCRFARSGPDQLLHLRNRLPLSGFMPEYQSYDRNHD